MVRVIIILRELLYLLSHPLASSRNKISSSFEQRLTSFFSFLLSLRPSIFISIFRVGGAVAVLGQHLVNFKCMNQDQSDAEVFYVTRIIWAVLPIIATLLCILGWFLVSKFKIVEDLEKKMKASVVILLYLLWPGLSSETFAMFACQDVCGESRLRVDINELCFVDGGRHLGFALGLGLPMLLFYVIGLPLLAWFMVMRVQRRSKEQGRELHTMKGHYTFGLFYSAYHPDVWWWESTVALRKIIISLIGVFGGSMGQMQIHVTACFMVIIMLLTAIVRPFGDQLLLHCLDLFALSAVWLTLWAGSVFNDHPRCEDGAGGTLAWCNVLSVVISVLVISCLVLVVAVIVYYKKKSREAAKKRARERARENGVEEDTSGAINETSIIELTEQEMNVFDFDVESMESNPMNLRREEGEESSDAGRRQGTTTNPVVEENNVEISQDTSTGGVTPSVQDDETITLPIGEGAAATQPQKKSHWSTLQKSVHATNGFKAGRKKKMKRLSQVMKARRNSATQEIVDEIDLPPHWEMVYGDAEGSNYYYNSKTEESRWERPEE